MHVPAGVQPRTAGPRVAPPRPAPGPPAPLTCSPRVPVGTSRGAKGQSPPGGRRGQSRTPGAARNHNNSRRPGNGRVANRRARLEFRQPIGAACGAAAGQSGTGAERGPCQSTARDPSGWGRRRGRGEAGPVSESSSHPLPAPPRVSPKRSRKIPIYLVHLKKGADTVPQQTD